MWTNFEIVEMCATCGRDKRKPVCSHGHYIKTKARTVIGAEHLGLYPLLDFKYLKLAYMLQ